MNRLKIALLLLAQGFTLFPFLLNAQNLVLNPSFETISSCPQGPSQFSFATNWSEPFVVSLTDTCSTSDLYNSCSFLGAGVPNNILGNEPARTGTGYAGIIVHEGFSLIGCASLFGTGWREYVQAHLSSPMVAGQQYCVSFYVSLADDVKWATDDFGVYLSSTQLSIPCTSVGASSALQPLGYNPQLQWTGGNITNTTGWTKLQWSYTATGGERYVVIGNFKSDANTSFVCVDSAAFNPYSYYYIDDVEVIQTTVCCPVITVNISSQTPVSCFGGTDGSVTVAAAGGAAPYTYAWSTGASGVTLSNRPAGNYTVTATDANGCTVSRVVNISQPTVLTANVTSSSGGCGTSASASPSGGTGPFTYLWSNGSTIASISNLATGTYSVTITDSKNCTASGSVSVTQSSGFALNTSSTSPACGVCDGTATATPSGGTGPFTYLWSNGQTTQTATNLCAGSYSVTVTESGSSGGSNVFWSENFTSGGAGWTLNIAGTGANDANANQWVINSNRDDCVQCPASGSGGNYLHVTCTSGVECIGSAGSCVYSVGVPFFSNAATDKYVTSPNISTVGKTNIKLKFWYISEGEPGNDYGLVRLSNNGGASWTDLPTQYAGVSTCTQDSISIPALYENIADFRIGFRWVNDNNTDGNGSAFLIDDIELVSETGSTACTATAAVNVSSANSPVVTLASKTDVNCFGSNNGAISITIAGGAAPYNFIWSNGATTQNITGLNGGNYSVTVTDNANCVGTFSATVNEPAAALAATANIVDAGCGAATGAINQTVTGGSTPYTFQWSTGSNLEDLNNLQAGNYSVTISDNNGCILTAAYTVNAPGNFSVALATDSASCEGVADGEVTTSITGGTAPYFYVWSTGATTPDISNVVPGSYSVTITDDNICTVSATATVSAPSVMTFTASITRVLCDGGNDGGIKLNPAGGTPPYSALWSNGESGLSLTDLAPGTYTATVIDANGCNKDTTISLEAASIYTITTSTTNASCDGAASGSVQVNITDATTPPYTYIWNTGDTTASLINIAPGNYSVTVSDSLNCLRNTTETVGAGDGLTIASAVIDASCPEAEDGSIATTVSGGTEPYSYVWNTGATTATLTQISADVYSLTVTDANNCTGSDTIIVRVDSVNLGECDTLVIYDVFSPNGDGTNDTWIIDGLESYPNNELQIFNRWGNLVFEALPYMNNWNGFSQKDEALPTATYYYILKLHDANETVHSGSVTLVR